MNKYAGNARFDYDGFASLFVVAVVENESEKKARHVGWVVVAISALSSRYRFLMFAKSSYSSSSFFRTRISKRFRSMFSILVRDDIF